VDVSLLQRSSIGSNTGREKETEGEKKEAKESGIGKKKRKSTIAPPQTPSIFTTEKVPGQHHQQQRNLDPSRLMQQ
jgi:hypothetical protein